MGPAPFELAGCSCALAGAIGGAQRSQLLLRVRDRDAGIGRRTSAETDSEIATSY